MKKNQNTILRVTLSDGLVIYEKNAIDTYVDVIRRWGIERVRNCENVVKGSPLIIRENQLEKYDDRYYRKSIGDLYIYSYTNNIRKKKFLERIANELDEFIKVEIVDK